MSGGVSLGVMTSKWRIFWYYVCLVGCLEFGLSSDRGGLISF